MVPVVPSVVFIISRFQPSPPKKIFTYDPEVEDCWGEEGLRTNARYPHQVWQLILMSVNYFVFIILKGYSSALSMS